MKRELEVGECNLSNGYIVRNIHGFDRAKATRRIYKPRPYDDAEYFYAKEINGEWKIIKDSHGSSKTVDYDNLEDIVEELVMANSAIKAKMIHN